ncbi:alkylmercury lyase [Thermotomaculum hydrothermale]|uniref:Alkylmercury lyase n=1 Tax=Thermotomaculum hydrothermale TaxID=981385 RepID=A0A7R6PME7_9BACT|nr:thioredoxin family protein [Thermotomaculum hydrothermale]BBB31791.1 alkylmercury lyase [Thermotomaculum hydrothermale]
MKIDILYFDGCPHARDTLKLIKEIVEELKVDAEIEFIKIRDLEDAKRLNFYGSPSVHINGVDLEEGMANRDILYGCRVYQTEERFSGMPPKDLIIKKILEAK